MNSSEANCYVLLSADDLPATFLIDIVPPSNVTVTVGDIPYTTVGKSRWWITCDYRSVKMDHFFQLCLIVHYHYKIYTPNAAFEDTYSVQRLRYTYHIARNF